MSDQTLKLLDCSESINTGDKFKVESLVDQSKVGLAPISEITHPVIGVFSGVFAKLDSMSVNKRFYSEKFWRKVLASPRVKEALSSGTMIGIFEHPNVMTDYDENGHATARHPQNGAFIVKRLWIEGRNIMGEAYLLNTPLGRLLATYFLAKDRFNKPLIQLNISARGYSREDYFDENGIDQMNPDDYLLQSFDVVVKPGIKGAKVKMESDSSDDEYRAELDQYLEKLESFTEEVFLLYHDKFEYGKELINELGLQTVK